MSDLEFPMQEFPGLRFPSQPLVLAGTCRPGKYAKSHDVLEIWCSQENCFDL